MDDKVCLIKLLHLCSNYVYAIIGEPSNNHIVLDSNTIKIGGIDLKYTK